MNTRISLWMLLGLLGIASLVVTGCYTQVGVTREEGRDQEEYANTQDENDSAYVEENGNRQDVDGEEGYTYTDDECCYRPRVGFSYYYPSSYSSIWPSYAFGAAYADPWRYSYYDSYYGGYSPWGYGSSNWGYGSYYHNPYYYNPYYSYYPYYSYTVRYRNVQHGGREIGTTREGGDRSTVNTGTRIPPSDRSGGGSEVNLPTGMRSLNSGSSRGTTSTPSVDATTRPSGGTRSVTPASPSGTPRGNTGVRNSTSRTGNSRVYRQRGTSAQGSQDNRGSSAPAVNPPARESGTQSGSTQRTSTPSYTPPPSAPAPSSGRGSAPSSSGSTRGGSTRGGRP